MKNDFFKSLLLALVILLTGAGRFVDHEGLAKKLNSEAIGCGTNTTEISTGGDGRFIPLLKGWGNHHYPISTRDDSAQVYFDQGLNFYYSYHFREAVASFRQAAVFDSACPMAYWGQALAMGPYYNVYFYKMKKEVPGVIRSMAAHVGNASEKERALIAAMQQRYSDDMTNSDRVQLDSSYAAAMSSLVKKYTGDDDMKALYVDAVMLRHKWDFWNNDGTAKPWTPELVNLCEQILQRNAVHPAALHYYIHVTEASRHPELALKSADLLKDQLPGVAHMVHMSTHMYQRNGLFAKGVYVNEDANGAYNKVDSLVPNLGIGQNSSVHIFAVQSYCAMNAGMFKKGMPLYLRARNRMLEQNESVKDDAYLQFVYMLPVIAQVRLGKWEEILATAPPDNSWKYASVLDNFARGLAYVRKNNASAAHRCLQNLEQDLQDSLLAVRTIPFNKPVQCGKLAAAILKGELLYLEGQQEAALLSFKEAVEEEDGLIYREPQEWMIPARQYLGACLLKMKRTKEAEKIYREDLVANPGNGWSLLGLYQSLQLQGKSDEASLLRPKYIKAFEAADVEPLASVF
jgi:tetratricopeptide (TPR) repeat protein